MSNDHGPVEVATRALVATLGTVSARQQVAAAQAIALARLADEETDGAKASALSRELRQVVATLAPAVGITAARPQTEAHPDPIQKIQDELARKRQERGTG
jgi:hypothetical protein